MKAQFNETLFFTATNLNWMPLLQSKTNKNYILECLNYLTKNDKSRVYAFVIMPNHVHLILDLISSDKSTFQKSFLSYTAKQCLKRLKKTNSIYLPNLKSTQGDRQFQFWERNPFWTHIQSEETMVQKIGYIHLNPVRKGYLKCKNGRDYFYSSAKSYVDKTAYFHFLKLTCLNYEWS
jgi:REP element-mobilizing transposase RayT